MFASTLYFAGGLEIVYSFFKPSFTTDDSNMKEVKQNNN
jgi:hypothetical protein